MDILNYLFIQSGLNASVFDILSYTSPVWLLLLSGLVFSYVWVPYRRAQFLLKKDWVLLEIKIPKEITKTPLAMELFLSVLFQGGGELTFVQRYWIGSMRPRFSLELVSIEGEVKFFIWMDRFWKNLVESQMYAQYPDIEIHEVPDYTRFVNYDPDKFGLWGCEFGLNKADAYPIKTYIDYGMDKEGVKEEYKIDPIASVLEYLGSLGKGEQAWIQIVVRAHKKKKVKKDGFFYEETDWKKESKEEVKKLLAELKPESGMGPARVMTKGEQETISAIERSSSKYGFDCGIRAVYIAEKDRFNSINASGLAGSFKQYNSNSLNGFKVLSFTGFNYPWQDYKNIRVNKLKKDIFKNYVRRGYFYNFDKPVFVLNTEELATIFHFPGGVAQTPTFKRIPSKKVEPPVNLPV